MKTKRIVFKPAPGIIPDDKVRLWIGIAIGMLTTIILYVFMIGGREAIRYVFSCPGHWENKWILTDREIYFYNFIFAYMSLLWGQAMCIKMWMQYPRVYGYSGKIYHRRISILNDQFGLNSATFMWFTNLGLLYGIWFGETLGFYVFSIYPLFNSLWILLVIVLFFEQWKTIRLIGRGKSFKWMALSFGIATGLSLLLAFFNPLKQKNIYKHYFETSVKCNYEYNLPVSDFYLNVGAKRSIIIDIYCVYPKNHNDPDVFPATIIDGEKLPLDSIPNKLLENLQQCNELDKMLTFVNLHADKFVSYKFIRKIKQKIIQGNISIISYNVYPFGLTGTSEYYQYIGIRSLLFKDSVWVSNEISKRKNFRVDLLHDSVFLDHKYISLEKLVNGVIEIVKKSPHYLFILSVSDDCSYDSYIQVYSRICKGIKEVRDEMALENFHKKYDDLDYPLQDSIRAIFPRAILEKGN